MSKGLSWATSSDLEELPRDPEWESIIEALSKLTPPQTGIIEAVDVSGRLTGRRRKPAHLTRASSERVNLARKRFTPDKRSKTFSGYITELDKDKSTFLLRDAQARTLKPYTQASSPKQRGKTHAKSKNVQLPSDEEFTPRRRFGGRHFG